MMCAKFMHKNMLFAQEWLKIYLEYAFMGILV